MKAVKCLLQPRSRSSSPPLKRHGYVLISYLIFFFSKLIYCPAIIHLCTLLVLLSVLGAVTAVNFDQCIAEVQSGKWGPDGGTDNYGNPVSDISNATSITYELCTRACGPGAEPFVWNIFSQQFR